jgi:hypothetical protein
VDKFLDIVEDLAEGDTTDAVEDAVEALTGVDLDLDGE